MNQAGGPRSCEGKLKHLGISAPSHFTLAYAHEHRPWQLYQRAFMSLSECRRIQVRIGKKKFRFKNKLISLDSSIIDLCLQMFDWAHFRRTKGAIKLHLILDHEGYLPYPLRRVEAFDPETGMILVFLTNNLDLGPTTIAAIYKDRWPMEIFFKALKQNLKIKTFGANSANAVKIQIWTTLIAMLILRFLQLRAKFNWSLSNLLALLRMNLFSHRDLWARLNNPFKTPPVPYEPQQLSLDLA